MSEEDFTPLPEAEERRLASLLRDVPRPVADPAFRARARHLFLAGKHAPEGRTATVHRLPVARRPIVQWAAAAAAVLVVTAGIAALNQAPAWKVTDVEGDGIAVVNQVPVPLGHVSELTASLRPGARLRVPEGTKVEFTTGGGILIQALGGTDMILPAPPARWFGRNVQSRLLAGELRIHTDDHFAGARLRVQTNEADVHITGTTLAVICEPHGTCVCVLEGEVQVGDRKGPMTYVDAGRRRFVYRDGRAPVMDEMLTRERESLSALLERNVD